jgi:hypothetical protein
VDDIIIEWLVGGGGCSVFPLNLIFTQYNLVRSFEVPSSLYIMKISFSKSLLKIEELIDSSDSFEFPLLADTIEPALKLFIYTSRPALLYQPDVAGVYVYI